MFGGVEPFVQFWWRASRRTILSNYFKIGLVVQEKMQFKDISLIELWGPLCSLERNHLCNFGRGHHKEQFCEIILTFG